VKGWAAFRFVAGGIHEALIKATLSAGGKEIRPSAGVGPVRQYLLDGLVDELRNGITPSL